MDYDPAEVMTLTWNINLRVILENAQDNGHAITQKQLTILTMKVSEAIEAFKQVGTTLTKASAEIKAKLEELQNADPDISEEGKAAIESVLAVANALDAIVPDVATDPNAPAPVITPVPESRRR